jgi:hypothetical protein
MRQIVLGADRCSVPALQQFGGFDQPDVRLPIARRKDHRAECRSPPRSPEPAHPPARPWPSPPEPARTTR